MTNLICACSHAITHRQKILSSLPMIAVIGLGMWASKQTITTMRACLP
jgi:hypothetical protein